MRLRIHYLPFPFLHVNMNTEQFRTLNINVLLFVTQLNEQFHLIRDACQLVPLVLRPSPEPYAENPSFLVHLILVCSDPKHLYLCKLGDDELLLYLRLLYFFLGAYHSKRLVLVVCVVLCSYLQT